ncbi:DUF4270 domain-containing protein [Flavobacterium amniphilum]|uniref:DUF4270 domain-containing protein n=1 Tax=Flavobacterium amniphilum TaxID=1834035 RepID=UPI00202A13C9|nr:DUF4270 domain-containing protein [Flavobacterium amniphilum]MCL9803928.1 DUF4270 domain-containing protein [Flavobacterium amniphilum]
MKKTVFTKYAFTALFSIFLISCDKDFNTVGGDIIEGENYDFIGSPYSVKAYNQRITPVQTNNLPINQLGISNDPIFGKTVANFVTQVQMATPAPTFGANIEIDSVVLSIPYSYKLLKIESSGISKFELDSINTTDPVSANDGNYKPINLKVFRNGFQLNEFDPNNLEASQKYYSNQDANFSSQIDSGVLNNSTEAKENTAFVPDAREVVKYKVKSTKDETNPNFYVMQHTRPKEKENVEKRLQPSMRLHLDKDYFKTHIIQAASSKLANNNIFKTYFKGLYFQVQDADQGTMMSLDFSKGNVVIYYKEDLIVNKTVNGVSTPVGNDRPMKEFGLIFNGAITANLFNKTENATYANAVSNPDRINGDQKLYLKGGEGSMSIIEIFTQAEIDNLKAQKVLINDASLYFTVNTSLMNLKNEPLRVYLFDVDNNKVLYDYNFDNSVNASNSKRNKFMFGGILEKKEIDDDEKKIYRIRITEHVNRILKDKQDNVRLGLVVTENINNPAYGSLQTPPSSGSWDSEAKTLKTLPVGSITSPQGTILYGSNAGADSVKFRIYYTKPN